MQRPPKDNSRNTSGTTSFKDLLKEQCFQLRRALKDVPEPQNPHERKGKAKQGDNDFQNPDKTVNIIFGGRPTKRSQKLTLWEIMSVEPATPTFLKWSEIPITFSRADQWTSFSDPGCFPLVLDQ